MHLDHARRCSGGRGRRGRRRPRRGSRRTRLPSSSICSALSCASGLSISDVAVMGLLRLLRARSRSGPSGALMQVRTISPSVPVDLAVAQVAHLAGAELADAGVADALAAAERQLEPASSPATRIGVAPSHSASVSLLAKLDRAALALLGEAELGLEALHVQALAVALALPVLGHRVEHLAGPGEERLALAPVRAELVEVARASIRPCSPVSCRCRSKPSWRSSSARSRVAEDHLVLGARRVEVDDVVERVARGRGCAACS